MIFRHPIRSVIGLGLLALALATLTSTPVAQAQPPSPSHFDGVTVFRGIYFGNGPVARLLPEIWDAPSVRHIRPALTSPKTLAVEAQLIHRLQQRDPRFFDRFASQLQSGNPVMVSAGLHEANSTLRDVLASLPGRQPSAVPVSSAGGDCVYLPVVLAAAAAVAAYFVVAAAVFVYVAGAVYTPIATPPMMSSTGDRLQEDTSVALITARLASSAR